MASSSDKFIKTVQAPPSKLAGPIGPEATTIPLQSLEGWASTTAVVAAIDRYDDSTNELTPSKTEIVVGIIGPNGLENVTRGVGGTKQTHSEGAVVEVSIAAGEQWNRAMDALIDSFGQDGKITKSAFAKDGDEYKQVVPGDAIEDGSLLPKKINGKLTPDNISLDTISQNNSTVSINIPGKWLVIASLTAAAAASGGGSYAHQYSWVGKTTFWSGYQQRDQNVNRGQLTFANIIDVQKGDTYTSTLSTGGGNSDNRYWAAIRIG